MDSFAPFEGLSGRLLIGATALLFVLVCGRVLGISGILSGSLGAAREDIFLRLALIADIVIAPLLLISVGVNLPDISISAYWPESLAVLHVFEVSAIIRIVSALAVGLVFGARLSVSGVINPAKLLGFSRSSGNWDPRLGLVIMSALIAAVPGYTFANCLDAPLIEYTFQIPKTRHIDLPLVAVTAMFGVGWALDSGCRDRAAGCLDLLRGYGRWHGFVSRLHRIYRG